MSPKKQPCDLNSICIKILSNQLIHALSDEEGIHQHKVSKYIYSATYDTLESLLQEILGKFFLKKFPLLTNFNMFLSTNKFFRIDNKFGRQHQI